MRRIIIVSFFLALFAVGAAFLCSHGVGAVAGQPRQDPGLRYRVDGMGEINLKVNPTKIAVRYRTNQDPSGLMRAVRSNTALQVVGEPEPLENTEGIQIVEVSPKTTVRAVMAGIEQLARADEIYYVSPVVQSRPGFDAVIDETFYVSLPADFPQEELDAVNEEYGVETLGCTTVNSLNKTTYTLRPVFYIGLDGLAMANLYASELPTIDASPAFICLYDTLAGDIVTGPPNDEYFDSQWFLKAIHVPEAWDLGYSGDERIVIAVLDTGVQFPYAPDYSNGQDAFGLLEVPDPLYPYSRAHSQWVNETEFDFGAPWEPREQWPDQYDNDGNGYANDFYGLNAVTQEVEEWFRSRYDDEYGPYPYPPPPYETCPTSAAGPGHGTRTAGVIAALTYDGLGTGGIAGGGYGDEENPQKPCRILPVKVWEDNVSREHLNGVNTEEYKAGIVYARSVAEKYIHNTQNPFFIVLCGGFWEWNSGLQTEIQKAREVGCILFAPSHNNDLPEATWPARAAEVICNGGLSKCGADGCGTDCFADYPHIEDACPFDEDPGQYTGVEQLACRRQYDIETGSCFCACNPSGVFGSNYGYAVDVMAPGLYIAAADIEESAGACALGDPPPPNHGHPDDFNYFFKTSSALPQVAGVAALVTAALIQNVQATSEIYPSPAQIQGILALSADDLVYEREYTVGSESGVEKALPGRDIYTGYGRINAFRAVRCALLPRTIFQDHERHHLASFYAEGLEATSGGDAIIEGDLYERFACDFPESLHRWQNAEEETICALTTRQEESACSAPSYDRVYRYLPEEYMMPAGSLLLRGKLYGQIPEEHLNALGPELLYAYKNARGSVTVAFAATDFVDATIEPEYGHTVKAGSLLLKGRAFFGANADRLSSQAKDPNQCEFSNLFSDRLTGQFTRLCEIFGVDPGTPDYDNDGILDRHMLGLYERLMCGYYGILQTGLLDAYYTNLGLFDQCLIHDILYTCPSGPLNELVNLREVCAMLTAMNPAMRTFLLNHIREACPSFPEGTPGGYPFGDYLYLDAIYTACGDLDGDGISNYDEYLHSGPFLGWFYEDVLNPAPVTHVLPVKHLPVLFLLPFSLALLALLLLRRMETNTQYDLEGDERCG